MKKYFALALALVIATAAFGGTAAAIEVENETALRNAVESNQTITLKNNIELDRELVIDGRVTITLDLNGKTLSNTASRGRTFVIAVKESSTLTIKDSGGTGKILNDASDEPRGIIIGGSAYNTIDATPCTVTLESGTIEVGDLGVAVYAINSKEGDPVETVFTMTGGKITGATAAMAFGRTAIINIKGGDIETTDYAIAGNGTNDGSIYCGGTEINISGGNITAGNVVVYHPQNGTLNISGDCKLEGHDGIQMKSGTVNITGGTITATGNLSETEIDIDTSGGTNPVNAALSILSQGKETGNYDGHIVVNVSGGTLTSKNGNAIFEANSTGAHLKFEGLTVNGGEIIGAAGTEAIAMTNATATNTKIEDGTFSSDLSNLADAGVSIPEMQLVDGKYVVVKPKTTTTGGGGGGCSAGFGALALLAVLPLFRMRRK